MPAWKSERERGDVKLSRWPSLPAAGWLSRVACLRHKFKNFLILCDSLNFGWDSWSWNMISDGGWILNSALVWILSRAIPWTYVCQCKIVFSHLFSQHMHNQLRRMRPRSRSLLSVLEQTAATWEQIFRQVYHHQKLARSGRIVSVRACLRKVFVTFTPTKQFPIMSLQLQERCDFNGVHFEVS